MPTTNQNRQITPLTIHYSLEIDGIQYGIFERIRGGDIEVSQIRHNVVYSNGTFSTLQIPGPTVIEPITLVSGYGDTASLYAWFQEVQNGSISRARKNATISLNSFVKGKYQPVVQWHLINVWPSKISGLEMQQAQTELAQFSITLVCESIEREDVVA